MYSEEDEKGSSDIEKHDFDLLRGVPVSLLSLFLRVIYLVPG